MKVQNFASEVTLYRAAAAAAAFSKGFQGFPFQHRHQSPSSPAIMSDGVEVAHAPIIDEKPRKVRMILLTATTRNNNNVATNYGLVITAGLKLAFKCVGNFPTNARIFR